MIGSMIEARSIDRTCEARRRAHALPRIKEYGARTHHAEGEDTQEQVGPPLSALPPTSGGDHEQAAEEDEQSTETPRRCRREPARRRRWIGRDPAECRGDP